uniref:uncharacterized protein zgc:113149 isoform X5 n=1 Tax=Doryrhamphus excisus TaxID=161450 RepID=UPI0025AE035D|nr:uncharacterized protein zgc:113149 isoform X5 [Doryrhamphus excisus]
MAALTSSLCDSDDAEAALSPWPHIHSMFALQSTKTNVHVMRCQLCMPKLVYISAYKNSTSNLKKHLQRIHPNDVTRYTELIESRKKRKSSPEEPPMKNTRVTTVSDWAVVLRAQSLRSRVLLDTPNPLEQSGGRRAEQVAILREQEDLVGGDSDWMPSRADYEVDTSVAAMSTSWNEEDDDFKLGGARGLRSKPRFSFSEVKLLLEAVRENRYILLRKFNHGVSSEAKKQKWAEITDQINNLGQNYREVRQIMKKWADLKCDGKRRLLALHAPNGSADRRRRKSSLGPVEKMVHEILLLSPKRDGISDVKLGGEDEDSKLSMEQGGNMSPSYPYPAPNSTLALPGGLSLDFSPLSSPEKEHSGDPFHSSSDFDQQEDAEPSMDFDDNDNSTSTFSFRSSFLPPTDNAQASSKPIQTYSRNQNYNATTSKAHGPPLFESDAASSPAAPLPSYSPSGANVRASTSSSSSPLAPPTTSLAANGSSQPAPSSSSIPPPSNHLSSSHIKHAQASDPTQADHLPSGHKAQSRVAQLACLSVQQQRATRHLLSSVSRSLETLAQSVQLLVESQQEFVQESLLLQRETVDILKDFSNTALTMMRDKSNSGQARHPSASNI